MAQDIESTASRRRTALADERIDSLATLGAGTWIGKYEIVAVLGQGGFGVTYRALDTHLRREVAIKEYLPSYLAARQSDLMVLPRSTQVAEDFRWGRARFLDEARILARLEHAAGVVNVHDFLEANGTAYMVMGLVEGETLELRLQRERRLSQPAIEQLLQPLLNGLEMVHAASFLHRDVKPANILIDADGQPTLIDFGASRDALQGRTQALTAVYTPGYAAFEQFTSARQGPWTDIYALGATLYHCVTGAPPPSASDRMIEDRLVPAVEAGKKRYAQGLLAAIDWALKLKAAERPQSIAEWRPALSGAIPTVNPGAPAARRIDAAAMADKPARARTRRRWPLMLAAAVLVLCLGGGGYVWWQGTQEGEAWSRATTARTEAAYRDYLAAWPTGRFAAEAHKAIADLKADEQAWRRAAAAHTEASYRDYLTAHPAGLHAAEAHKRLDAERRAEEEMWSRARSAKAIPSLRAYLDRYPSGRYAAEARILLAEATRNEQEATARRGEDDAWAAARAANSVASLRAYLDKYPSGQHAAEARRMVMALERAEQEAAARRIEDDAWMAAKAASSISSLRGYLERYPQGRYADEARGMMAMMESRNREPQPSDCPQCPEMVRIPPGSFIMGAAPGEHRREGVSDDWAEREWPPHRVTIGYGFSLGKFEVTRGEFAAFVQATGHRTGNTCFTYGMNARWSELPGRDWRSPGFEQTDRDPVVCVNWNDASAYVDWLRRTTGRNYRLPTEAEWEYAARAGTSGARYWGDSRDDACRYGNFADLSAAERLRWPKDHIFNCRDGYAYTAPVGSFEANAFHLHDMLGNVFEWTGDCWNRNYANAPTNGDARWDGDCSRRVLRGGPWKFQPKFVRAANRDSDVVADRSANVGFRVARTD